MSVLNIVIPMAGVGSRFAVAGYELPKPFIDVNGKMMIERVLENLAVPDARFHLIARQEHAEKYPERVNYLKQHYPVEFELVNQLTLGAACTVLKVHRKINNATPLLIANSDQLIDLPLQQFTQDAYQRNLDGSILTFWANDAKWSYAKTDEQGYVTQVAEKQPISDFATVGIYWFKEGRQFIEATLDMISANDRVNNEFYVCPVYNYLIQQQKKIGIYNIDPAQMHGIGTPEDLAIYLKQIAA